MSNSSNDGIIKFKFNLKMSSPINEEHFLVLEKWRSIFHKMNLIGEYKTTKLSYGNMSKRLIKGEDPFVISGAQTGGHAHLSGMQYTKVTKCILPKMSIEAVGPIAPDSESLTHFAIYSKAKNINFIFHIHSISLWNYLIKNGGDKTPAHVDHRSQEFQDHAIKCIENKANGIFAIGDLEGGVLAYAENTDNAGKLILDKLKESRV